MPKPEEKFGKVFLISYQVQKCEKKICNASNIFIWLISFSVQKKTQIYEIPEEIRSFELDRLEV